MSNNKMSAFEFKQKLKDADKVVGIDPGTHTGVAIWRLKEKCFERIVTMSIVDAMHMLFDGYFPLVIEDARTRSGSDAAKMGAGSIRRDCAIWQEFADSYGYPIWWRNTPRGRNHTTKLSAEKFKALTGWNERTSNHARDAAMLVWGM